MKLQANVLNVMEKTNLFIVKNKMDVIGQVLYKHVLSDLQCDDTDIEDNIKQYVNQYI